MCDGKDNDCDTDVDEVGAVDSPTWYADTDGDGYGDNPNGNEPDAFPLDWSQWQDSDGDGYGDDYYGNNSDDCVYYCGNSPLHRFGCAESDGDGISNPDGDWSVFDGADAFISDATQWSDEDGDGYGDNATGIEPDACPGVFGNSTIDRYGCVDNDGDGISNESDSFPDDPTRSQDTDTDGFDDLEDNCINVAGNSTEDRIGCPDTDGDGLPNNKDK